MKNIKILRFTYWTLFVSTLLLFWYSLRYSPEYKVYTTAVALLLWGIAFLINRRIKKLQVEENSDE